MRVRCLESTARARRSASAETKDSIMDTMKKPINKWSDEDRKAFQAGVRLRAQTIPNKRREASRRACRGKDWAA